MFGDIYPMKHMGKHYFWKYQISAVTKLTVQAKIYAESRENKIELFMQVYVQTSM